MYNREIWNIENIHMTAIFQNKTEKKYKNAKQKKFLFIKAYRTNDLFEISKSVKLPQTKCLARTPSTHKRRDAGLRGNYGMDVTP